jgi:hypothetical protein
LQAIKSLYDAEQRVLFCPSYPQYFTTQFTRSWCILQPNKTPINITIKWENRDFSRLKQQDWLCSLKSVLMCSLYVKIKYNTDDRQMAGCWSDDKIGWDPVRIHHLSRGQDIREFKEFSHLSGFRLQHILFVISNQISCHSHTLISRSATSQRLSPLQV